MSDRTFFKFRINLNWLRLQLSTFNHQTHYIFLGKRGRKFGLTHDSYQLIIKYDVGNPTYSLFLIFIREYRKPDANDTQAIKSINKQRMIKLKFNEQRLSISPAQPVIALL
jgi:hypothetical protein